MNNTQFQTGDQPLNPGLLPEGDRVDSAIVNHNSHCINALDEPIGNNPEVIEITDQPINYLAHIERYSDRIIASMNNGCEDNWE